MEQERRQPLLSVGGAGSEMGPTITSLATPFSGPLTRLATAVDHQPHHHSIFIDDDSDVDSSSNGDVDVGDDDDDDPPLPLSSSDCGYSGPFVYLDMIWNLAFALVSFFVLLTTIQERPSTPLRLWISGYALQCLLHVWFVWAEYQRRSLDDVRRGVQDFHFHGVFSFSFLCHNRIIKKMESINTVVSSVWWVFGFYWIVMGDQSLLQDSPRLYWLSVVFLAFDVFFMIFCIAMACLLFFAMFCCFPILATIAYAMTIGEGASENDIRALPKYRYHRFSVSGISRYNTKKEINLTAKSSSSNSPAQLSLCPEDSECCICLYRYVEGVELCKLPCNHHFHHKCIGKWLRIKATCPLCKFNILGGDMLV